MSTERTHLQLAGTVAENKATRSATRAPGFQAQVSQAGLLLRLLQTGSTSSVSSFFRALDIWGTQTFCFLGPLLPPEQLSYSKVSNFIKHWPPLQINFAKWSVWCLGNSGDKGNWNRIGLSGKVGVVWAPTFKAGSAPRSPLHLTSSVRWALFFISGHPTHPKSETQVWSQSLQISVWRWDPGDNLISRWSAADDRITLGTHPSSLIK